MPGIQTSNVLLDPAVKKEIDNLLYRVALLDTAIKNLSNTVAALSIANVSAIGHTTTTPIEANGLTSNSGVLSIRLDGRLAEIKINSATGRPEIFVNGEKPPAQSW